MSLDNNTIKIAAFRVGPHECGLDIMSIREIVNPLPITPVPQAPVFMEGVVEIRNAIVPMVDLRKRFGLQAENTPAMKYIIVSLESRIIGLAVDAVTDVLTIPREELRPAPRMIKGHEAQPVAAMCRYGGRLILVLDLNIMLTSKEKLKLQAMDGENLK